MRTSTKKHTRNGHDLTMDWLKIKNALTDTATDVKDKAGLIFTDSVDGIKSKSTKVKRNVATYTAKRPFTTLGVALATGIAIGFLLRRR